MKMNKEERVAYDRYLDENRLADSLLKTAENKGIAIGEQRERNKNIISTIEILDDMGTPKSEIIEKIKVKFNISEEEIVKLLPH